MFSKMPKGKESGQSANARRRFILQTTRRDGEVTFEEIKKRFPAGNQSLIGDDKLFDELGLEVRLQPGKGKFALVRPIYWTYEERKDENPGAKNAIGVLAAQLAWGSPADQVKILEELNKKPNPTGQAFAAERYLRDYWRKKSRILCLDAGSTTIAVANSLKSRDLPDEAAGIAVMRVVTNCPKIEEEFEDPRVKTEVILVGGSLRKLTRAHTGLLTEQCLDAWNIRIDIAIIGTTGLVVDVEPSKHNDYIRGLACDSEDEARTKALLLHRSSFRCVIADSSKLESEHSSAFAFAQFVGLSPNAINLIITDDGRQRDDLDSITPLDLERRARRLKQIRAAGIAVLEAR
jgi:DeoR/GlpR family transcriptional regulator of sugar metabolism